MSICIFRCALCSWKPGSADAVEGAATAARCFPALIGGGRQFLHRTVFRVDLAGRADALRVALGELGARREEETERPLQRIKARRRSLLRTLLSLFFKKKILTH